MGSGFYRHLSGSVQVEAQGPTVITISRTPLLASCGMGMLGMLGKKVDWLNCWKSDSDTLEDVRSRSAASDDGLRICGREATFDKKNLEE